MTRIIIHPGEHLADELKALGMSANKLAKELGVSANRITQIIAGKRGITGDTALRLGKWFGTGSDIWMSLQKIYELQIAAQGLGDTLKKISQHRMNGTNKGREEIDRLLTVGIESGKAVPLDMATLRKKAGKRLKNGQPQP